MISPNDETRMTIEVRIPNKSGLSSLGLWSLNRNSDFELRVFLMWLQYRFWGESFRLTLTPTDL
jgi:hypothetical protein